VIEPPGALTAARAPGRGEPWRVEGKEPHLNQTKEVPVRLDQPPPSSGAIDDLLRGLERDGLEFRLLDSTEITEAVAAEMLALFRSGFGRWPWSDPGVPELDHLRWKTSGPATRLGSYQGRIHGRLVYAATVFASWVRIAGVRRLRVVLLDACVDPSLQGRGIYSRAVSYRQHVLRYRCDFSMHERSQTGFVERRMASTGHRPLANRVTALVRVLQPSGLSPARAAMEASRSPSKSPLDGPRRLLARPASLALWALGAAVAATRRSPGGRPRTAARFDQRFDALFEAAAGSFDVIGERTAEFLSWRYGDPRGGRNVVRELAEGERLVGYSVVRSAGPRAYLSDLLALPDRPHAIEALVADAVEVAAHGGASTLECWLPRRHPYRAALWRRGFFDRGRDAGISYHPVEMPAAELELLGDPRLRIHYTLGDTDLV
jgi:hypothetical protein